MDTLRPVPLFEELDASELQSIADAMHEACQFTAITHTTIGR